jgi:calcineurin-like phosphoesterase family protein
MSKIFLIGDTHIALGYPNKVDKWFNTHIEYFDKFLFPLLEREISDGDIIVHLGDFFDNRNIIPINLLNYGMTVVERLAKLAPLHILIGNHDCWHKSTSEINTMRPFKYIPNVFIYEETTQIDFMGKSILMMPYIEKKKEQVDLLNKFSTDYLFCHSDLNGAKMHLTSVAHKNNDKIDVEAFSGYKNVYSGHIHLLQRKSNFTFIGSIFEMDRNDTDNQKGLFILDVLKGTERFIPNNISPKFKKVYLLNEGDIESLGDVSTKDYIDLFISNSLLINNRKLRRKLEVMLETGNFASVEYLDDLAVENINKEDKIVEHKEIDIENIQTIELEYTEMIKTYINNQKHDSDKIKKGILNEFNEIVSVYEDNYKNLKD